MSQFKYRHYPFLFTPNDCIEAACEIFGCTIEEFHSSARRQAVVDARTVWVGVMRDTFNYSFPELAAVMGKSYHSTVHSARMRYESELDGFERANLHFTINRIATKLAEVRERLALSREQASNPNHRDGPIMSLGSRCDGFTRSEQELGPRQRKPRSKKQQ